MHNYNVFAKRENPVILAGNTVLKAVESKSKNDNNDKTHFADTEQQLQKRTSEEVHLQMATENTDDADVT